MKKFLFLSLFLGLEILFVKVSTAQNTFPSSGAAGIGTTSPNASSLLDVVSTSKGVLIPRMTKAQRDAIASPAEGLLIYQTNSTPGFYYFDGSAWKPISTKGASRALDNLTTPTAVNVDLLPATDNTLNLGSAANSWKDGYFAGDIYLDDNRFISNPGNGNTLLGNTGNTTNSGIYNTWTGESAGNANTSGTENSFYGYHAGMVNTTGSSNTFIGGSAGITNTIGSNNAFVGLYAGYYNTTGSGNTFVGSGSGLSNTTGNSNTFAGDNAGYYNTTGNLNSLFGQGAGYHNSTGSRNCFMGYAAGAANSTGSSNVFLGTYAGDLNTTGYSNTFLGEEAGDFNTTGHHNVFIGDSSGKFNSTGSTNTAVGAKTLSKNTTGFSNVAMGNDAGRDNLTGSINVFIGDSAGVANTTGIYNTFVGGHAGTFTTASYNTFVGEGAGSNTSTGRANSCVGVAAGFGNVNGNVNTYLGDSSGYFNSAGRANTMVGYQAGLNNTTNDNSCFGYKAGYSVTSGDLNTFIGHNADCGSLGTLSNSTAIGNGASVTISNCVVLGNSSVTKIGIGTVPSSSNVVQFAVTTAKLTTGGAWTNASDRKLKNGFEKLRSADILDKVNQLDIERWHYIADGEPTTHIGPIAQDFHELFRVGDDTTISTIDPSGVALLAIQELSKKNDEKDAQLAQQQKEIDNLKNMVLDMQQSLSQCCMSYQSSLANRQSSISSDAARLDQNVPNPFDEETVIQFYLPSSISSAQIVVSDLSGHILKTVSVQGNGVNQVAIHRNEFAAGTYQYSLLLNGKVIDTKQMVLTK